MSRQAYDAAVKAAGHAEAAERDFDRVLNAPELLERSRAEVRFEMHLAMASAWTGIARALKETT